MKVVYSNGNYFVKDNKSKFLRFNENGKLLNQIGRLGKGPGEYLPFSNFVVHPETHNIYISAMNPVRLMLFTPEGKFIKPIDLTKQYVQSMRISGNNIFLFYLDDARHNEENMELLDINGNIITSYPNKYKFERNRVTMGSSNYCLMYSFGGKLHFKEIFSDTVFYIEGQEMIPQIILNSDDKRFTPEKRYKAAEEILATRHAAPKSLVESVSQENLIETGNFLFYSYGVDRQSYTLVWNKSTWQSH